MKTKFNLCMLLLLGASINNGARAMETQENGQTKKTICAKFLYNHPWVSSAVAHVGGFALAWRFKRFKNYVIETIEYEAPKLWLPLFMTVPTGSTISKRYGHNLLMSSGIPHRMKKLHSICRSGCKGQYEDYTEKELALKEIDEQEKAIIRNYKSKKYNY